MSTPLRFSPRPHRNALGFTLIELIVVVAVVAILASIAIPNYIAAQGRAKVSRLKQDMRGAALAVEAYAVDHDDYPPIAGQMRFTTPIGYIASWPRSPFSEPSFAREGTQRWEDLPGVAPTFAFVSEQNFFDPLPTTADGSPANPAPRSAEGAACPNNCEDELFIQYAVFPNGQRVTAELLDRHANRTRWVFISGGIDEDYELDAATRDAAEPGESGVVLYDPTNGIFSNGDILYWSSSIAFLGGN